MIADAKVCVNDHVLRSTDIGVERKVQERGGEREEESVGESRREEERESRSEVERSEEERRGERRREVKRRGEIFFVNMRDI